MKSFIDLSIMVTTVLNIFIEHTNLFVYRNYPSEFNSHLEDFSYYSECYLIYFINCTALPVKNFNCNNEKILAVAATR